MLYETLCFIVKLYKLEVFFWKPISYDKNVKIYSENKRKHTRIENQT